MGRCDSCEMLSINGVACHETGCPNAKARWDAGTSSWVRQHECFECGCQVDDGVACCQPEEVYEPDYDIVDLGVDHPGYFQGFGTSFTRYAHSVYGVGDTAQDAYDDALEQMACMPDSIVESMPAACPFSGSVDHSDDDGELCEIYYHVGVRWNT